MTTQTATPSARPFLTPLLLTAATPLLLTQTSSVIRSIHPDDLAPETLTFRATHVTVVLGEILDNQGYRHGGINE